MSANINSNINSLVAQTNLSRSQGSLSTTIARLSSGLRINSSADDAAGYAIAQGFTAQINGTNQAVRNAADGVSLAQTAGGALNQITADLQRIRQLAVQSSNATNSASDRAALQQEVGQLVGDMQSIATTTKFNGLNLLDGSYTNQQFQVGANVGNTINVSVGDARTQNLGATVRTTAAGIDSTTALNGALSINGVSITGAAGVAAGDVNGLVNAINAQSGAAGVTASRATTNVNTLTYTANANVNTIKINGVAVTLASGETAANAASKINAVSAQTGVTVVNTAGSFAFTSANGSDFNFVDDASNAVLGGDKTFKAGIDIVSSVSNGAATVTGANALTAALGAGTTYSAATVDISTAANAQNAIKAIDYALQQVAGTAANLGAVQNRFQATIANLQTTSTNLSASRSAIQDADFASETANLSRSQVLQQAGTAVLAQANQLPNQVLSLLR